MKAVVSIIVILFAIAYCGRELAQYSSPAAFSNPGVSGGGADAYTMSLAKQFASRCNNAMDTHDFAAASVFCQDAAEHWGDIADQTTGQDHETAFLYRTMFLAYQGAAERNSDEESDGESLLKQARSDALAISRDASDAEIRAQARKLVNDISL